jgi:fatty-acyl-CoA synthase
MNDWFEKITIGAALDRAAETFGPRIAFRFAGQGWTFRDLHADVNRAARGLLSCGIQPRDKVALWLLNRPEWLHIWLAVVKIGAVLVPINTRFRTNDLAYVLHQSDSTILITAEHSGPIGYLDMVRELIPQLDTHRQSNNLQLTNYPALRRVITVSEATYAGTQRWDDVVAAGDAVPMADLVARQDAVDPGATCVIMYTSGTTGFPKGVMHNHSMLRMATDIANRIGIRATDVLLMYLPFFHIFGLYQGVMVSLVTGACQVITEQFDPGESLRLIEQERVTRLYGFDTHFHDLMQHPDCEQTDRSSLRLGLLAAGMASTEPVARRVQTMLCPTVSGWGMTESGASPAVSYPLDSEDDRCTASGVALPGYTFKVIDPDTGAPQPYGTPGELCCKGYQVMQGYYQKPDETAKTLDAEGWLHTGDMATMRDDGTICFVGRYKEILKVGGENVDPVEVEAFLLQHPAINQVKIVGVSDSRLHEVGCACVVLEPGANLTLEELRAFSQGKVASFKIPHHMVLVKDYPMTSSGKVQKFKLQELCVETLGLETGV